MQKKSQLLVYKYLILSVISAIVVIVFLNAGKSFGSQDAHYKLAVAKDLALTIDIVYSLPGDIEFIYPNELSDYDIEVTNNLVRIYSHRLGALDPTQASHDFVGISRESINVQIKGQKHIKLIKKDGSLNIIGIAGNFAPAGGKSGGGGASWRY